MGGSQQRERRPQGKKKRLIGGYIYSDRHCLPAKGERPRVLFDSFFFSPRIFSSRLFSSLPVSFLCSSSSLRLFALLFFSLLISALLVLSSILFYFRIFCSKKSIQTLRETGQATHYFLLFSPTFIIFSIHLRPRWGTAELNRLQGIACTTQWVPLCLSSSLFSPTLVFVCLFIVYSLSLCKLSNGIWPCKIGLLFHGI